MSILRASSLSPWGYKAHEEHTAFTAVESTTLRCLHTPSFVTASTRLSTLAAWTWLFTVHQLTVTFFLTQLSMHPLCSLLLTQEFLPSLLQAWMTLSCEFLWPFIYLSAYNNAIIYKWFCLPFGFEIFQRKAWGLSLSSPPWGVLWLQRNNYLLLDYQMNILCYVCLWTLTRTHAQQSAVTQSSSRGGYAKLL